MDMRSEGFGSKVVRNDDVHPAMRWNRYAFAHISLCLEAPTYTGDQPSHPRSNHHRHTDISPTRILPADSQESRRKMQGKLSGFMNKAKETASAAGGQASTMWKVCDHHDIAHGSRQSAPELTGKDGSSRASTGSQGIMAGFSLPGESAKAAKILKSFLGAYICTANVSSALQESGEHPEAYIGETDDIADPSHPQTALNSIPKAVIQKARGTFCSTLVSRS